MGRTTDPKVPSASAVEPLIRSIEQRLEKRHGSPRLGNPTDPLDDLVFILLSARTRGVVHEEAYKSLKVRFDSWSDALVAGPTAISRVIERAGFGGKRGEQIYGVLAALQQQFGSPTLKPLASVPDRVAERILTDLPGVGLKTARCVMMYSLSREVFPVDAHIARILGYFGLVSPTVRIEFAQTPVQDIVPLQIRYSLHVNLVAHGRNICIPNRPLCGQCPLSDICPEFRILNPAREDTGQPRRS